MLGVLIFTISFFILYSTAVPIIKIRSLISEKIGIEIIRDLIECVQCSAFWLSPLIFILYPYIPMYIIYGFNISALITIIDNILYRIGW